MAATGDLRSRLDALSVADLLARCTFSPPGTEVICAVSGGPDSSAMLVLACAAGLRVTAVHVDHGLRPGSAAEADVVARLAAAVGAGFEARRVDVGDGPNLEARARAARYGALPPDVLTGHTLDDQAETVLLNLLRGASTSGLAGMRPSTRRPLLALRRAETHRLCATLGIEVIVDASNDDPRHLRNRVRAELLPLLDDLAGRDVAAVLARQAQLLRADDDLLDELAAALDPTDARALAAAPEAVARRAVRAWLRTEHPPDGAAVARVLAVARGAAVACEVGDGRRVARRDQRLRVILHADRPTDEEPG